MKQNKDERIRELEGFSIFLGILFLLSSILAIVFIVLWVGDTNSLEQELRFCQEKVSVPLCTEEGGYWVFEVSCDYGNYLQGNTIYRYGDYDTCIDRINFWLDNERIENCEVISNG